jgi:transposase-like protein
VPRRNVAAAKAFFRKAIKSQRRCPQTITLDGYAASHRAVRELKADGSLAAETKLRSSKYLNNLIEEDHRSVKQRIAVMLGFKGFSNAAITITGIELLHRIRKGQFKLRGLGVQDHTCSLERSASSLNLHGVARIVCSCWLFEPEPSREGCLRPIPSATAR